MSKLDFSNEWGRIGVCLRKGIILLMLFMGMIMATSMVQAQTKTVLLDISHEQKDQYTKVNPRIFDQYQDIVENKLGATLIINEDKELTKEVLSKADVLIILSPLSKSTLKNLTTVERVSIVDYVKNGGKLMLFTDEDHRMDVEAFGANDIVKPFGMVFGSDLPHITNVTAISFIGEVLKGKYVVPYTGSRELTGGVPLSVMNAEGGHVHGAYTKLDNGGKIAAFAETMVALFLGGIEAKRPNGETIVWLGNDDKQFMQDLIEWMLKD